MTPLEPPARPAAPAAAAGPGKVRGHHLERLAVVYVRQSTPQQVLEHRESAALQYALRDRARAWGWPDNPSGKNFSPTVWPSVRSIAR